MKICEKFCCYGAESELDDFCVLGLCENCREYSCFNCGYFETAKCLEYKPKAIKSQTDDKEDNLPF